MDRYLKHEEIFDHFARSTSDIHVTPTRGWFVYKKEMGESINPDQDWIDNLEDEKITENLQLNNQSLKVPEKERKDSGYRKLSHDE